MNDGTNWSDPGLVLDDRPASDASYRVLARKYRPATFDDLIGQDAMVRTVSKAFEAGRIPQAWILTGVRGVGKTTTARILARALNYELPDGTLPHPICTLEFLVPHHRVPKNDETPCKARGFVKRALRDSNTRPSDS